MVTALVTGAVATIAVAWGCAIWSPARIAIDPFPDPSGMANSVDPDGVVGLHAREGGFGWEYLCLRGVTASSDGWPHVD